MALFTWMILFVILHTTFAGNVFKELAHIKASASPATQTAAAQELIRRLLPARYHSFRAEVIPYIGSAVLDTYKISSDGFSVNITGTTGVAVAWGLQHYLKHYCGCHISWSGDQLLLPAPGDLPVVELSVTSPNRYRYYQNVCTPSYSFAWWNWTRWERHIDWMALNGINLPLAFTGQEAIWQKVYLKMGFKQDDLDSHFGGPAFLAWARMGNIHGWGGPLPQSWHTEQLALQHQILTRMRDLGMISVLPGFAGHVPKTFPNLFPNASVSLLGDWGSFGPDYCCTALLDPRDPMFKEVGKAFIEAMIEEFNGTDHVYSADTFNENVPQSSDPSYLSSASRAVYEGITAGDPHGVWLMQGWLFQNTKFWGPTQIKALLHGVPIGRMIVLDLFAEARPIYNSTESFYGQPFIWCMLHNFGGNTGLYGKLDAVNKGPLGARLFPRSTMIGMGLTPEGISQNDVVYNFFNDLTWRSGGTNVTEWIKSYSTRRYSGTSADAAKAWWILQGTVYNNTDTAKDHQCAVPVRRPTNNMISKLWYDYTRVADAWYHLLQAAPALTSSSLYRYDLVDVTRNVLQDQAFNFYEDLMEALTSRDKQAVRKNGALLCDLIMDMDKITSSHSGWLLGPWLEAAKSLGRSSTERTIYEFNARNQLSLWGPTGEVLDYANKQWGGLLRTYYHGRWVLFVQYLEELLDLGLPFNRDIFNMRSFIFENSWANGNSSFPVTSSGDTVRISQDLYTKYKPYILDARSSGRSSARIAKKRGHCGFETESPYSYRWTSRGSGR